MSSMLFVTSKSTPIRSSPYDSSTYTYVAGIGEYFIVTEIWYNKKGTSSSIKIGENDYDDSDPEYVKFLYCQNNSKYSNGYISKDDMTYVANFEYMYNNRQPVNKSGTLIEVSDMLYGPHKNSPILESNISIGTDIVILALYDNYYYTSSGGWILQSKVAETSNDTASTTPPELPVTSTPSSSSTSSSSTSSSSNNKTVSNSMLNSGISFETESIYKVMRSAGIYRKSDIDKYNKFNRFGYNDPYNGLKNTKEYVFFTKPDLHIFNNRNADAGLNAELENVPFFKEMYSRYKPVLRQLQSSADTTGMPFINILSNSIRSSIDMPTINADEVETSSNIYGMNIKYRKSSVKTHNSLNFNTEFIDTKFLEIYMLFKIFDEYSTRKLLGEITPPDLNYVYRKILHDQISVFKFIVGEDGQSLIYWAKFTGCFPESVPRDVFSDLSSTGDLKINISWRAQFVEDMIPDIIDDFNKLVLEKYNSSTELPLYDRSIMAMDGTWAKIPYIAHNTKLSKASEEIQHNYFLRWRK